MYTVPTQTLASASPQDQIITVHIEISRAIDGLDVRFTGLDEDGTTLLFNRVSGVTKVPADIEALANEIIRRLFEAQGQSAALKAYLQGKTAVGIV